MLDGAKRILELFDDDEIKAFIIEGDHGFGKSSYANRLIAEVYSKDGIHGNWDINQLFPRHIGFVPKHVINLWSKKRKRDYCFHWDDAGLWLHNLDFQNKFVKDVGKYMQVVRSDFACVMFTAISKEDISSKIRGLRNAIVIEITKLGKNYKEPNKRTASAYIPRKTWKGRPWKDKQWEETFNSHVPGSADDPDSFYGWYKPLRDEYATIAKALMKKDIDEDADLNIDVNNI